MTSDASTIQTSLGFVGRQRELEQFTSLLREIETNMLPSSRFLHLWGPAGIGKTALLKEYFRACRYRDIACAYISFEKELMREEEKDADPGKDSYSETIRMIAEQLARCGIEQMNQLITHRGRVQLGMKSQDLEERRSVSQALERFADQVLKELVSAAHERPVVLLIDGLEDPSKSVREKLELSLLIRFTETPNAMVVSASRAPLPVTWSDSLRDRFRQVRLPLLSSQEVDQLLEFNPHYTDPDALLVRNSPLMKYVREIGQGHPVVTGEVFDFLVDLVSTRREAQRKRENKAECEDEGESGLVQELARTEIGDLLDLVYNSYVEPFALRDIDLDPWGATVYRVIVPARYFDLDSLRSLLVARGIPRESADCTEQRATRWLEERGLVHRDLTGAYAVDSVPRNLLVRRMAHSDGDNLKATVKALVDINASEATTGVGASRAPLAIREYLYHLYNYTGLTRRVSEARLEKDILDELTRCLTGLRSRTLIDALLGYFEADDDMHHLFPPSLMSKMLAAVRRLIPGDSSTAASEQAQEKEDLVGNILNGSCVLFLGPGLTLGPDYLEVFEALAHQLVKESGCTVLPADLEDVAQCYAENLERRSKLPDMYAEYLLSCLQPDRESLNILASLPFRAVITTATDLSLEEAYGRARWPVQLVYSVLESPKVERGEKLLIKLYGSVDKRDDLVITRQRHLRLKGELAGADDLLDSILRAGVPLFIGFSSRDPMLLFLHVLIHDSLTKTVGKSFIALDDSSPFLSEAWQTEIVTLDQSGKVFLKELQERWQNWQSGEMHIWDEAEVLKAVSSKQPIAGKLMSRITFEENSDLSGQDLSGCVITSGLLNGVLLNDAVLERTDLSNAALQDAQLKNCRASRSNLTYANANRAKLGRAQFKNATLTGVSMHDVEVTQAVFDGADLIYAELDGARGEHASFLTANLLGSQFAGAQLPGAIFRDSLIWGASFKRAKLPGADFSMSNLVESRFDGADLKGASFYFANLEGADFSGADLRGANFSQALLAGADFHDATGAMEARFESASWHDAKLPLDLRRRLEQAETDRGRLTLSGRPVELAHEALTGNCILFVGPGLTLGPQYLDTYDAIRRHLAAECGLPETGEGFQDVAQFYASTKGLEELTLKVAQEIRPLRPPSEVSLDLVVSLPFDVIVTTAVDTLLEKAYERAGRPYERTVSVTEAPILEKGEDLIIRLHGGIDILNARPVLTRRDRYQLQAKLAQGNSILSRYIGRRAPLFVGFSLRDPMLYLLHTLIASPSAPMAGKSFVALDEPHPFFGDAWQPEGLVVLDRSSQDLLEDLHGQWVERKSEERRIWRTQEVLEAVRNGRPLAGKRMSRVALEEGTDLRGQDLRGSVLASATLNGVMLNAAQLQGADLSRAELEDAQMDGCNLSGANAVFANLSRTTLVKANLGKAALIQASLRDATLTGGRLTEADLIFADLQGACGEGVDFSRARSSSALFSGARLAGAIFRGSFCEKAEFRHAELAGADFEMTNLAESKFEGANLTNASFRSSNLFSSDFSGANIDGADFSQARLDGADFQEAVNAQSAVFTGSTWRKASLSEDLRQRLEQIEAGTASHCY